jgi:hypothetical protein
MIMDKAEITQMTEEQMRTARIRSMDVDAGQLITLALDKGVAVDTMERLLAMRREIKAEAAREAYFEALAAFQYECPVIQKKVNVKEKEGGKTRYKYAPIEDMVDQTRDLLRKYGFSWVIKTKQDANGVSMICEAHHRDGHVEQAEFRVPIDAKAYMNDQQKVGSAATFAARYAFKFVFGLVCKGEDDDANSISKTQAGRKPETTEVKKAGTVELPTEARTIYQACISLLNEKVGDTKVFIGTQAMQYKKGLDAIVMDLDALKKYQTTLEDASREQKDIINKGGKK